VHTAVGFTKTAINLNGKKSLLHLGPPWGGKQQEFQHLGCGEMEDNEVPLKGSVDYDSQDDCKKVKHWHCFPHKSIGKG
jgi:hypothetical protein